MTYTIKEIFKTLQPSKRSNIAIKCIPRCLYMILPADRVYPFYVFPGAAETSYPV